MTKNLAIIPVRTGSKRLPQKNLRDFHGRPLFTYSIDCAINSDLFDEVHISTESEEVAAICAELGVEPAFLRPDDLASDDATLQQVCDYVIAEYEKRGVFFETFCILWATAPLRSAEDVRNGHALLADDIDAVVGVTSYDLPVFCAQLMDDHNNLQPLFPDMLRLPSREMREVVCDNGTLCWVKTEVFKEQGTWLPSRLRGYNMPRDRSCDIDTEDDWDHAHYLYGRLLNRDIKD